MKTLKITKILEIEGYNIHCLFSNQAIKRLDFQAIFQLWDVNPKHIAYPISQNLNKFNTVQLTENSLSWSEIGISSKDEQDNHIFYPYELDPLVLYELGQSPLLLGNKHKLLAEIKHAQVKILQFIGQHIAATPIQIKTALAMGNSTLMRYLKQFKQTNLVNYFKIGKNSFYSINFAEISKTATLSS